MIGNAKIVKQGGGASLENGIEIVKVDSSNRPTEIKVYGNDLSPNIFGYISAYEGWKYLAKVQLMGERIRLRGYTFAFTRVTEINLENVVSVNVADFRGSSLKIANLSQCTDYIQNYTFQGSNLEEIYAPKIYRLYSLNSASGCFRGCTYLKTAIFGSVGHKITSTTQYDFGGCTQSDLTITFFTDGSHTDTILANCRAGATNATIIIKSSEDTTYNGETYLAGETILTSEVA